MSKKYENRETRYQAIKNPKPARPEKALLFVGYYRKSTESDERQVQSIPDQKKWARTLAENQNLRILKHLEESMSGRKSDRPEFVKALQLIESGAANALIAYDVNRLTRNADDGARLLGLLESGKLRCIQTAFQTFKDNPNDKFMLGFMVANSKLYTDNLSEVVMRGMNSKADKGIFPGPARLGYINHPKTKEPEPDPAVLPQVVETYKLYSSGKYSLKTLGDRLFAKGIATRTGKPFSAQHVANLLSDPFYYGAFVWCRVLYPGIHEPAVSKELWDKAQEVMAERSRPISAWSHEFPFCGLMNCANCGCSITAESHTKQQMNGNVHTWVYYRCTKKNRDVACKEPFTRQESLVAQFIELTGKVALPEDWAIPMLAELDRMELEAGTGTVGKMLRLDSELEEIAAKLRRLNDLNVDGEIDRTEYAERKRGLVNKKIAKEALKLKIAQQGELYWLEPLREIINAVREPNLPTAGGDPQELRNFVARVGSNLRVESRKVLWDWVPTYALLAERGLYQEWWAVKDSNPRPSD